jgi:hypothetical protein
MSSTSKPRATQAVACVIGIVLLASPTSCGLQTQHAESSRVAVDASAAATCPPMYPVPDSLVAPDGRFVARVAVADRGLRTLTVVSLRNGQSLLNETHDLVNLMWVPGARGLLYAVSPTYDKSGIYFLDTTTGKVSRLVSPTHTNDPAYPDGTDFFVLCAAQAVDARGVVVRYIHLPDVEGVNFKEFPYDAPQQADTVWFQR